MSIRKAVMLGVIGGLMVAGALAYLDRDVGPDIATCGTCQGPRPPSPVPVAVDALFGTATGTSREPVEVEAIYVDGIKLDPENLDLRVLHGLHPLQEVPFGHRPPKPGRCCGCHIDGPCNPEPCPPNCGS